MTTREVTYYRIAVPESPAAVSPAEPGGVLRCTRDGSAEPRWEAFRRNRAWGPSWPPGPADRQISEEEAYRIVNELLRIGAQA